MHAATTGAQRLTLVKPEPNSSVLRAEGLKTDTNPPGTN